MTPKQLTSINDFKTNLSEDLQQIAFKELGETIILKQESLSELRIWIKKNHKIKTTRIDDAFLLRFIRTKKFRKIDIQNCLERYLLLRKSYDGQLFQNLNMKESSLDALINMGYIFPLPERDPNGRRIILCRPGVFDMSKFNKYDMLKIHGITYETIMENEEDQIKGVVHIVDAIGINLSYLTLYTPKEALRIGLNAEAFLPMRHRAIHAFNINKNLKFAVDFAMYWTPDKFKKRIFFHNSVDDIKNIPKNIFPKEYGGTKTMKDMIDLWKVELKKMQPRLLLNDKMELCEELYPRAARIGAVGAIRMSLDCNNDYNNDTNQNVGIHGTFKKLEID